MKALLTASLFCHASLLKVQRLPSQGKHFDPCEPLAQKMIVRSFVDYIHVLLESRLQRHIVLVKPGFA